MARTTAEAIPASDDDDSEGIRAALRGDAESLAATVSGDISRWQNAARFYETAQDLVAAERRSRVLNNLGFALLKLARRDAAITALQAAAALPSSRSWIAALNGRLIGADEDERRATVDAAVDMFDKANRPMPPLGIAWAAAVATDPEKQRAWANKAIAAIDAAPLSRRRSNLGLELEGILTLRLGVTSTRPTHFLEVTCQALVWLAPTPPLGISELRALAARETRKTPPPKVQRR